MDYKETFVKDINGNKKEIILELNCYCGKFIYNKKIGINEEYILSKTATTPMYINKYCGNISQINNGKIRAIVNFSNRILDINNIRPLDKDFKLLDRILLSEHLTIDGNIEWVASKKPIKTGDLNFLTITLRDKKTGDIAYKERIDVITGESKEI